MKKFLLAAALMASASVNAAPVFVIDDFLSEPNPTELLINGIGDAETTGDQNYSLGGFNYTRNILFQAIADPQPNGPGGQLWTGDILGDGNGMLSINNGTNVKTRTTLTYDITSLYGSLSTLTKAAFAVIFSDGVVFDNPGTPGEDESLNSTNIEAFLNGNSIGLWTLTCPIATTGESCDPEFAGFGFDGQLLSQTGPNYLTFVINGPAGYDLNVDQIAVEVPEPAMLGLFGLGLMGLAAGRRRKTA